MRVLVRTRCCRCHSRRTSPARRRRRTDSSPHRVQPLRGCVGGAAPRIRADRGSSTKDRVGRARAVRDRRTCRLPLVASTVPCRIHRRRSNNLIAEPEDDTDPARPRPSCRPALRGPNQEAQLHWSDAKLRMERRKGHTRTLKIKDSLTDDLRGLPHQHITSVEAAERAAQRTLAARGTPDKNRRRGMPAARGYRSAELRSD